MEWTDVPESPLFRMLVGKGLPHPTSRAFSDRPWLDAVKEIEAPSPRDYILAAGALEYGRELQTLRAFAGARAVEGLTTSAGIRLLAAMANQQYLTLVALGKVAYEASGGEAHLESIAQAPIASVWDQELSGDDHSTNLVDSLPSWLFSILQIPPDVEASPPLQPQQFGTRAMVYSSLEHGLRNLWHDVLWSNYAISGKGPTRRHVPLDRALAVRWFAWHLRQQNLDSFETNLNMGAAIVARGALGEIDPVVARTVVRLGRGREGRRTFKVGPASRTSAVQRGHAAERDMLERLYTGLFLDEPLPKFGELELTTRELAKAWWVLADLGRLVSREVGDAVLKTDKLVGRAAIPLDVSDVVTVLSEALQIPAERARVIVDVFTAEPSRTDQLFGKGLWFTPLLPDVELGRCYLLLAPLLVGSSIRRVEYWLELGGISDTTGVKGRGKPFEAHVRDVLGQALSENELLPNTAVLSSGLKRRGSSEEIDLLARIGNTVLVGEVKCFTRPTEAMTQYNYLRRLSDATAQAARKQSWCEANRTDVAGRVGVTKPEQVAELRFKGLVVVNHSFGVGLERNNVPIVDLHFLRLLLGFSEYQGTSRFEAGVGMTFELVKLYKDEADFSARLDANLSDPPVMDRYLKVIGWRDLPFIRGDGGPFSIAIPVLSGAPM